MLFGRDLEGRYEVSEMRLSLMVPVSNTAFALCPLTVM